MRAFNVKHQGFFSRQRIFKTNPLFRGFVLFVVSVFLSTSLLPVGYSYAQSISPVAATVANLPVPGSMVTPTHQYNPSLIKGIRLDLQDPLKFDFLVDRGEQALDNDQLRDEANDLIKYFLASLTTPEEDMWVNLSPYEADRIVPESFGQTEMGRDLLAQDYLLKQLTASLMYPEDELGSEFWERVYQKAQQEFGTTDIPMNTFNKVWIVPDQVVVYEQGQSAFILESRLKVMLASEYEQMTQDERREMLDGQFDNNLESSDVAHLTSNVIKEILIPEIEREVNEGSTFAKLRQIYHSLILASWYKKRLYDSLLGQVYVNKNKIKGVDVEDKQIKQKIYEQYVEAINKGVYNFTREEYDPLTQSVIPRKYFSGGLEFGGQLDQAMLITERPTQRSVDTFMSRSSDYAMIATQLQDFGQGADPAILEQARNITIDPTMIKSDFAMLANIESITIDDIDFRDKTKTPRALIREALEFKTGAATNAFLRATQDEILDRMRNGEVVINPDLNYPIVQTIFGEIDLTKLNDVNRYEGSDVTLQIARDLELAHYLGYIKIDRFTGKVSPTSKIKRFAQEVFKNSRLKNVILPWDQAYYLRNVLMPNMLATRADEYQSNSGQIRFIQELKNQGKISSSNLGNIFTALEREWVEQLDWSKVDLPLEEAIKIRSEVEELVSDQERMAQYRGNTGQIRFVTDLRNQGRITSTHLGHFFAALEDEWGEELGWNKMNLSLEGATTIRSALESLMNDPDRISGYQGNAGQIRFVSELIDQGQIKSVHLSSFYDSLEKVWIEQLNWKYMDLPLKEAVKIRSEVEELAMDEGRRNRYLGNAGQIRFMTELRNQGRITSTNLAAIYNVSEDTWIKQLGWEKINLPLEEAIKVRSEVEDLLSDQERMAEYQGNAGQIRYVTELRNQGRIASTNLGHFYSALEDEWVEQLGWEKMDLPLSEAIKIRSEVEGLLSDQERMAEYQGNAGQIRYITELKNQRKIRSTNLGNSYSALEDEWVEQLGWSKMDMSLRQAVKIRSEIEGLVGDEGRRLAYQGNAGQIRYVIELGNRTMHLSNFYSVLEEEWVKRLAWSYISLPLNEAIIVRSEVEGLIKDRENVLAYQGKAGEIRFVSELEEQGKIKSTNLAHFYSALEDEWLEQLGWGYINLSLEEAIKIRTEVEALLGDKDRLSAYQGNAGQIRYVQQLKEEKRIITTNLVNLYSALEDEWIEMLKWNQVKLPFSEAVKRINEFELKDGADSAMLAMSRREFLTGAAATAVTLRGGNALAQSGEIDLRAYEESLRKWNLKQNGQYVVSDADVKKVKDYIRRKLSIPAQLPISISGSTETGSAIFEGELTDPDEVRITVHLPNKNGSFNLVVNYSPRIESARSGDMKGLTPQLVKAFSTDIYNASMSNPDYKLIFAGFEPTSKKSVVVLGHKSGSKEFILFEGTPGRAKKVENTFVFERTGLFLSIQNSATSAGTSFAFVFRPEIKYEFNEQPVLKFETQDQAMTADDRGQTLTRMLQKDYAMLAGFQDAYNQYVTELDGIMRSVYEVLEQRRRNTQDGLEAYDSFSADDISGRVDAHRISFRFDGVINNWGAFPGEAMAFDRRTGDALVHLHSDEGDANYGFMFRFKKGAEDEPLSFDKFWIETSRQQGFVDGNVFVERGVITQEFHDQLLEDAMVTIRDVEGYSPFEQEELMRKEFDKRVRDAVVQANRLPVVGAITNERGEDLLINMFSRADFFRADENGQLLTSWVTSDGRDLDVEFQFGNKDAAMLSKVPDVNLSYYLTLRRFRLLISQGNASDTELLDIQKKLYDGRVSFLKDFVIEVPFSDRESMRMALYDVIDRTGSYALKDDEKPKEKQILLGMLDQIIESILDYKNQEDKNLVDQVDTLQNDAYADEADSLDEFTEEQVEELKKKFNEVLFFASKEKFVGYEVLGEIRSAIESVNSMEQLLLHINNYLSLEQVQGAKYSSNMPLYLRQGKDVYRAFRAGSEAVIYENVLDLSVAANEGLNGKVLRYYRENENVEREDLEAYAEIVNYLQSKGVAVPRMKVVEVEDLTGNKFWAVQTDLIRGARITLGSSEKVQSEVFSIIEEINRLTEHLKYGGLADVGNDARDLKGDSHYPNFIVSRDGVVNVDPIHISDIKAVKDKLNPEQEDVGTLDELFSSLNFTIEDQIEENYSPSVAAGDTAMLVKKEALANAVAVLNEGQDAGLSDQMVAFGAAFESFYNLHQLMEADDQLGDLEELTDISVILAQNGRRLFGLPESSELRIEPGDIEAGVLAAGDIVINEETNNVLMIQEIVVDEDGYTTVEHFVLGEDMYEGRTVSDILEEQGLRKLVRNFVPGNNVPTIESSTDEVSGEKRVGGINFNPQLLDMQIKRDGNGVPLPAFQQPMGDINVEGFIPIIINITPVTNLPQLLGMNDDGSLPVKSAQGDVDFDLSYYDRKSSFVFN